MRFLVSVIDSTPASGTPAEAAAIDAFNDRLQAEGHWVFACGISDPAGATLIDNRDGAGVVTPGPLNETAEWMSGFWIIDAPDHDIALALAAEGSRACHRRVEVRALL